MRGIILIDHYKNKTDHLTAWRRHPVAQSPRLAQQIIERVLSIVVAVSEAANVQAQSFLQMIDRKRPYRVLAQGCGHNDLRLGAKRRDKEISDRLQNSHLFLSPGSLDSLGSLGSHRPFRLRRLFLDFLDFRD